MTNDQLKVRNYKKNLVIDKSYEFALRIVGLYKYLTETKREYVISKQVLKSGTSIGANVEEAIGGQSKRDFLAKMYIAYKETRETRFWLRLLCDAKYITKQQAQSLLADCDNLTKVICKIISTTKTNLNLK